jgi:DNA polymerase-3 subunit alpha
MVYQEQVMRIAQVVGNYSLGAADLLRRAMGKKKPEEMAKQRSIFVDGAKTQGVSEPVATELFDLMEKFAGYGFNKSHSAAYALVAYQTAYFKAHHPAAFMAANLSAVMDDTDQVKELIEDCKALNLKIVPPDVNASNLRFEPGDAKSVRYGLGGVKGTGQGAIELIIAARSHGPFKDLFDFCRRLDKQVVNRRVVEALVRAGAFDSLDPDRAKLFASVGRAMEAAEKALADAGQVSLFGGPGDGPAEMHVEYVTPAKPWSERERLANEKLALGYYFSGHLFTEFAQEARRLAPTRLAEVKHSREQIRLAGIIVSARTQNTRRGRMGVIVLDDGSAQLELMVFAELFDRRRNLLKEDTLVFVTGRVRFDEFNQRLSVSADDVMDLATARTLAAARLQIEITGGADVTQLRSMLAAYRANGGASAGTSGGASGGSNGGTNRGTKGGADDGADNGVRGCRVVLSYVNAVATAELALSDDWMVRPDDALIEGLRQQRSVRAATFAY